jgi:hypothetical protein
MNASGHYESADLAMFALQLLPRDEYASMAEHVQGCTYCRQELAQLQGDLATYAQTVEMHSPPALTRERLLKQVAREKKVAALDRIERVEPVTAPAPTYPTRGQTYRTGSRGGHYLAEKDEPKPSLVSTLFTKVFPWIGWAAAAGLAIAAGSLYHEREAQRAQLAAQTAMIDRLSADAAAARQLLATITDPSARQVTLSPSSTPPVPEPLGRTIYVADKGALIFLASNLEPLEQYKTYELWLIPADGRDPIPAGTFHPDTRGNASVILPPLPKGIEAKAFGVTIEDEGGSQTPTMPIVLAGS